MDVQGVAWFYVSGGNFISLVPYADADKTTIELYLNGSAYGAILHQRKTLPLHGSCFLYECKGIMICGEAGAGKSSLTASFCLSGSEFLTDDVTPLLFFESEPFIWALSDRIKLWSDTLKQLKQEENGLDRIYPEIEKYYYPMDTITGDSFRLDQIYILEISETKEILFNELFGSSKFAALRSEIYRLEYLQGMPLNELVYFKSIVDICNNVRVVRVQRPKEIKISELTMLIRNKVALENNEKI
ncbi:MAG: hypothetical protein JXN62_08680, partial [Bacteroidales bacterium]|nr:hypothetical protein [Bacteroidales bacterium]